MEDLKTRQEEDVKPIDLSGREVITIYRLVESRINKIQKIKDQGHKDILNKEELERLTTIKNKIEYGLHNGNTGGSE